MITETHPDIDDGVSLQNLPCVVCSAAATKRCSSCKVVRYCCEDHQSAHWVEHKRICREGRAMLRVLANIKRGSMPDGPPTVIPEAGLADERLNAHVHKIVALEQGAAVRTDEEMALLVSDSMLIALMYISCMQVNPYFGRTRKALADLAFARSLGLTPKVRQQLDENQSTYLYSEERIYLMLFGYDIDLSRMVLSYGLSEL